MFSTKSKVVISKMYLMKNILAKVQNFVIRNFLMMPVTQKKYAFITNKLDLNTNVYFQHLKIKSLSYF